MIAAGQKSGVSPNQRFGRIAKIAKIAVIAKISIAS
jgi:hypothetical protein